MKPTMSCDYPAKASPADLNPKGPDPMWKAWIGVGVCAASLGLIVVATHPPIGWAADPLLRVLGAFTGLVNFLNGVYIYRSRD